MNEISAASLRKARRLFGTISRLQPQQDVEVLFHACYYAMLHAASALLQAHQGQVPDSHAAIIRQFGLTLNQGWPQQKLLGRLLADIYRARLIADYSSDIEPLLAEAPQLAEKVNAFILFCETACGED